MKTILEPSLLASLVLSTAFLAGCHAPDDSTDDRDTDTEEDVAVAEGALMEGANLGQFFANGQNKPVLSVGRGAGTEPDVCPSGQSPGLGLCWPSLSPAECPGGKEMADGSCYPVCPPGYHGVGPVCWIDEIDRAACQALYNPTIAQATKAAHRARTFGLGAELAAFATVGYETGVYYGENGEYGCYTSSCTGAGTDIGMEVSFTFGDFNNLAAFTGDGFDLSVGVGIGAAGYTQSVAFDTNGNVVGTAQQVSIGVGVSPIAVSASTCDTEIDPIHNSLTVALPGRGGRTLYAVAPNGNLLRSHLDTSGEFDVVYQPVGWSWGAMSNVSAVDGGHIYAVDSEGNLRYFHHDSAGQMDNWGTVIGDHWDGFTKVFAARFGEIYAIDGSGQLHLYQHDAALDFYHSEIIGPGWAGYTKVFSGGTRAIYAVDSSGNLLYWYFGDNGWIQAMQIGTGWDGFVSLASTGNGEIYGLTASSDLFFYRHNVDKEWVVAGEQIGWSFGFGTSGIIPASF